MITIDPALMQVVCFICSELTILSKKEAMQHYYEKNDI